MPLAIECVPDVVAHVLAAAAMIKHQSQRGELLSDVGQKEQKIKQRLFSQRVLTNSASGNNCENRLTVKQHLAVFFDVVGVSVPHVHAKDRELGEQSGFTRSSIEFPSVRETRQKADLCWAKIFVV